MMTDKLRDEILENLARITDVHEKLINGDSKLGIKGLRERQQDENLRNKELVAEVKNLELKMEGIHGDIKSYVDTKFDELRKVVNVVESWKNNLQTTFKRLTSWGFWVRAFVVLTLIYTAITKGIPGLVEWLGDKMHI